MGAWLSRLGLLLLLALRSLWTHKVKSFIVGALILFGTFLVVVGLSLLDSVQASMQRSIVHSLAGHLQIYSADAPDQLALFGSGFGGQDDIGEIRNFPQVKAALLELPEVRAVVPMGIGQGSVTQPGEFEQVAARLREAVRASDAEQMERLSGQLRQIARDLLAQKERERAIASDPAAIDAQRAVIARLTEDAFWEAFRRDPMAGLEYLDTKVAPLTADAQLIFLRYLGTDLDRFAKEFDRFELVEGEMVPRGRHGMLLSSRYTDRWLKHPVARMLDRIHEAYDGVPEGAPGPIATDPVQRDRARRLPDQYRRITYQLDPEERARLDEAFARDFPEFEGSIEEKVRAFLTLTDENFRRRYAWFYEHIAPLIEMRLADVGEVLTVRTFTKRGYVRALNLKVYGIFRFKGLEESDLAGAQNLIDLPSFRELYGVMTEESKQELAALKAEVGGEDVPPEEAEEALFGGGEPLVESGEEDTGFDPLQEVDLAKVASERVDWTMATYDPEQIDDGVVLNAAVLLRDGADLDKTKEKILRLSKEKGLGIQVVDWQEAAGILGQFIWVIRAVLYIAIGIIFLVAFFIINNSMVIATMERVSEIGTMRAIGAQRGFVLAIFMVETAVLGLLAGVVGGALGAGTVEWLGRVGIPAGGQDILHFLFSGPRLFPHVTLDHVLVGLLVLIVVSIFSTLYPALLAIRVPPVVAMGTGSE
ncbi:MAG: FtsX-like permease family protein [Deltaproteobacteria bacterium]|nr:MAG: FtsX-like permease family protein [Deltaproteobacteria bacterium]